MMIVTYITSDFKDGSCEDKLSITQSRLMYKTDIFDDVDKDETLNMIVLYKKEGHILKRKLILPMESIISIEVE
jgi:hypothetical protein